MCSSWSSTAGPLPLPLTLTLLLDVQLEYATVSSSQIHECTQISVTVTVDQSGISNICTHARSLNGHFPGKPISSPLVISQLRCILYLSFKTPDDLDL